jgi:hypothetical protein
MKNNQLQITKNKLISMFDFTLYERSKLQYRNSYNDFPMLKTS